MTLYQECRVCKTKKPLKHFHKDKHSFTGHKTDCIKCVHINEQLREALKMRSAIDKMIPILFPSKNLDEVFFAAHVRVNELKEIFKEFKHDRSYVFEKEKT